MTPSSPAPARPAPHSVGRRIAPLVFVLSLVACQGSPPDETPPADGAGEATAQPADASATPAQAPLAPSFDCARAEGEVEELICRSPELAALDLRLDTVWQAAQAAMEDGGMPEADRATLRAEQRGWVEGRNECWQSDDVAACVRSEYEARTAGLQAGFGLVRGGDPTFWACEGNPANEFVLTFFETEPPSVRVERGDQQEVMIRTPTASGSRYLGTFGKEVWTREEEGTFVWPQTDTLSCALRG